MHKILMVDDEPDLDILVQQRFRREIQQGFYRFFFVRHGRQALTILKMHPDVSIVVSDLNMPEMDGLDLLLILKKDYPHLKVMMLSAYEDQENCPRLSRTEFMILLPSRSFFLNLKPN